MSLIHFHTNLINSIFINYDRYKHVMTLIYRLIVPAKQALLSPDQQPLVMLDTDDR